MNEALERRYRRQEQEIAQPDYPILHMLVFDGNFQNPHLEPTQIHDQYYLVGCDEAECPKYKGPEGPPPKSEDLNKSRDFISITWPWFKTREELHSYFRFIPWLKEK